jgi:hypothetical protein
MVFRLSHVIHGTQTADRDLAVEPSQANLADLLAFPLFFRSTDQKVTLG